MTLTTAPLIVWKRLYPNSWRSFRVFAASVLMFVIDLVSPVLAQSLDSTSNVNVPSDASRAEWSSVCSDGSFGRTCAVLQEVAAQDDPDLRISSYVLRHKRGFALKVVVSNGQSNPVSVDEGVGVQVDNKVLGSIGYKNCPPENRQCVATLLNADEFVRQAVMGRVASYVIFRGTGDPQPNFIRISLDGFADAMADSFGELKFPPSSPAVLDPLMTVGALPIETSESEGERTTTVSVAEYRTLVEQLTDLRASNATLTGILERLQGKVGGNLAGLNAHRSLIVPEDNQSAAMLFTHGYDALDNWTSAATQATLVEAWALAPEVFDISATFKSVRDDPIVMVGTPYKINF